MNWTFQGLIWWGISWEINYSFPQLNHQCLLLVFLGEILYSFLENKHVTTLRIVRHFGWCCSSGPWFNMKMLSYQYRKSHWGDKTILRPSYLHNGISYTGKMTSLYWIRALDVPSSPHVILFLGWINICQKHSNSFNSCIIIEIVQIFTKEYCQDLQVNLK